MKLFLSWSKPLSHCIAGKLREWLCNIFPKLEIFMSSQDIATGARWNAEISKELESTSFGILVLTDENVGAPWIHFEAGALSKELHESKVCPLLVNIESIDIPGPLKQFQSSEISRDGILRLIKSINKTMDPAYRNNEDWPDRVIDIWWPHLEASVKKCLDDYQQQDAHRPEPTLAERMLEEVLEYVRLISQEVQESQEYERVEPKEKGDVCMLLVKSVLSESETLIKSYRKELPILHLFNQAGITGLYKNRRLGVAAFTEFIQRAKEELYIVGSSLKGLILEKEYQDLSDLILKKSKEKGLRLRFLLTHPCVADLRARQEKRNRSEIGREVITTLKKLQDWDIPVKCVRLYMGTPTCFGIKADDMMLLNPYPYGGVSYNAPCILVQRKYDATGFFFDAFDASHFGVWESQLAFELDSYKHVIEGLELALDEYSELTNKLLSVDPWKDSTDEDADES